MIYILHDAHELEIVADKLTPFFEKVDFSLLSFPFSSDFIAEKDDLLIAYLDDSALKSLFVQLPKADKWQIGILPHPEAKNAVKGFGLSTNLEEAIQEILSEKEFCELDILTCNKLPVFQSVNIGEVFIFSEDKTQNGFLSQLVSFLKNVRRLPALLHRSFILSADGEPIVHTSALGIVAVEHASGSIISKRLISRSAINDGKFQALILSPQNLFQLLLFLFKSLLPKVNTSNTIPSFIGSITASNLKIENESGIEFTNDGEKFSNKEIQLEVEKEKLKLQQKSIYALEKTGTDEKKSLKIDKLPTGERRDQLINRKLTILPRATTEEFQDLFKVLRENAKTTSAFIVMMILATLIATFGLFGDSSPVIIGAMILAPIISPIVSFSMGMVRYDPNMLKTGVVTILIGTVLALIFAAGVSIIIPLKVITGEIEARLTPNLLDMGIAVASGVAAAYAHAKEGIAKSLAGVAIAVALVPPLAVAGIGIGWWDWEVFSGAFLLYLTNLAGIIMFAGITFLFLGFAPFKRARMGLVYTLIIISIVMVPLSLSFNRIKQEARITSKLEGINFEKIFLRDIKVRTGKPIMVSLKLVSPEAIDSEEMKNIKKKIEEKLGEAIILEVISAIEF